MRRDEPFDSRARRPPVYRQPLGKGFGRRVAESDLPASLRSVCWRRLQEFFGIAEVFEIEFVRS
jgi:hypothetical protein